MALDPITTSIEAVGYFAKAYAAYQERAKATDARMNTPEMLAAEFLKEIGEVVDSARLHVKTHNLNEYRKDIAAPGAAGVLHDPAT